METSPIISRAINSLRPTRSEENLVCHTESDDNPPIDSWSQEDDDISQQVIFFLILFWFIRYIIFPIYLTHQNTYYKLCSVHFHYNS